MVVANGAIVIGQQCEFTHAMQARKVVCRIGLWFTVNVVEKLIQKTHSCNYGSVSVRNAANVTYYQGSC